MTILKMESCPERYAFINCRPFHVDIHLSPNVLQISSVHSSIITPQQDKKTREEVLAQQSKDVRGKERYRNLQYTCNDILLTAMLFLGIGECSVLSLAP